MAEVALSFESVCRLVIITFVVKSFAARTRVISSSDMELIYIFTEVLAPWGIYGSIFFVKAFERVKKVSPAVKNSVSPENCQILYGVLFSMVKLICIILSSPIFVVISFITISFEKWFVF